MKIVHILGRGLEGCGVTRYAKEFHDWCDRQGHESMIVALSKSWTVGKLVKSMMGDGFYDLSPQEFEDAVDQMLDADLVITHSFPPKSVSDETKRAWDKLLTRPRRAKMIHSCLDHNIMSWIRNYDFWSGLSNHDGLSCHVPHGKLPIKLKQNGVRIPIHQAVLGYNFGDTSRWMSCAEQDSRVAYVGRFAGFKQPLRMRPIREQISPALEIEVSAIGLALVFGTVHIRFDPRYEVIPVPKDWDDWPLSYDKVVAGTMYKPEHGFEFIRRTAVCADFYELPAYSPGMEFAMFEIINNGSCLLTSSMYLNKAPVLGNPGVIGNYIDKKLFVDSAGTERMAYPNNCGQTEKADCKVPQDQVDELVRAIKDPQFREEMRIEWFEHVKALYSADDVYARTLEEFMSS